MNQTVQWVNNQSKTNSGNGVRSCVVWATAGECYFSLPMSIRSSKMWLDGFLSCSLTNASCHLSTKNRDSWHFYCTLCRWWKFHDFSIVQIPIGPIPALYFFIFHVQLCSYSAFWLKTGFEPGSSVPQSLLSNLQLRKNFTAFPITLLY